MGALPRGLFGFARSPVFKGEGDIEAEADKQGHSLLFGVRYSSPKNRYLF
jgi:hypothetical protein